jgi:hypothetical protein
VHNVLTIVPLLLIVTIGSSYGYDATRSGIDASRQNSPVLKDSVPKPGRSSAPPVINSPAMPDPKVTLLADARTGDTDKAPHGHTHTHSDKPRSKYDLRDLADPGKPGLHTHDHKDGEHRPHSDGHTHDHEDSDTSDHAHTQNDSGPDDHGHDHGRQSHDEGDGGHGHDHDEKGAYDRVWDVVTQG